MKVRRVYSGGCSGTCCAKKREGSVNLDDKIATIVPVAHFDLVARDRYHMALSHLMGKDPKYTDFFTQQVTRGSYVIMDNGVVETGKPESLASYIAKAVQYGISEVVIPDHPESAHATVQSVDRFFEFAESVRYSRNVMAVPHGNSWEEWCECLDAILSYPVDTVGISRLDFDRGSVDSRPKAIEEVVYRAERWGREKVMVHLLGCTNVPDRNGVGYALSHPRVRGIDSSLAALWTKHGQRVPYPGTRPKEWEPVEFLHDALDKDLLVFNIAAWKSYARAGY